MSKNNMVAFGTQFRGYNKADVNAYIEKKSNEYAMAQEKCEKAVKEANDKLEKQNQEIARLCEALTESDKIIVSQKSEIDALKKQNDEIMDDFENLRREIIDIEEMAYANAKPAVSESPERPEITEDKESAPISEAEELTLSGAIKAIKSKLAKFLR